jgi:hypothetical protein
MSDLFVMTKKWKPLEPSFFDALAKDQWIRDHSPLDPAKIHALGCVTIAWNSCETNLYFLFTVVVRADPKVAWILCHDMGDLAISARIKEIIKLERFDGEERAIIIHTLDVYDICRQNRNSLTHFKVGLSEDGDRILMRMKGPSINSHSLPSNVDDFRRVALELDQLAKTLRLLWRALASRADGNMPPLPDKLVEPAHLWTPLLQANKEPGPQRPPSLMRLTEEEWIAKYRKEGRSPSPE